MPADMLDASTQTTHYRDAIIAGIYKEGYAPAVLPTFLRELQTIQNVMEDFEITLCEFAATAAYLSGELELTKEILMRVPGPSVTSYINTLYQAIAIKKWGKDMFNTAIGNGADNAIQQWEITQQMQV
jgi:predicted membrane-bound spermidine synthase